jgi:hypothetical protein
MLHYRHLLLVISATSTRTIRQNGTIGITGAAAIPTGGSGCTIGIALVSVSRTLCAKLRFKGKTIAAYRNPVRRNHRYTYKRQAPHPARCLVQVRPNGSHPPTTPRRQYL